MAVGASNVGAQEKADGLTRDEMHWILAVTRKLAAPFDLDTMLNEVVDAAKSVLDAESGTVWLYDAENDQLVLRVATDMEPIRVSAEKGIVGECVRSRELINVPDCYADPRFNREIDRQSGYRTRCMLTLPLIGHDDALVGALQILNKQHGVFDADDEMVAQALAAQCAVALQRVQMTQELVSAARLKQEISVARDVQMGTLPKTSPVVAGYDIAGMFRPADETGGDTFDFVPLDDGRLTILMGDATGHGIGPALSATQVRAMLRVAMRLGAPLDDTFRHINDQLVVDLPEDRFVTAFLGTLDPRENTVSYHAGGQGPLLHFKAASGECDWHPPTTFPLGAMPLPAARPAKVLALAPGDILALLSDGVYEYEDAAHLQFGEERVAATMREHYSRPMPELIGVLLQALADFGDGAAQSDDITMVLVRRLPADAVDSSGVEVGVDQVGRDFPRTFDSLCPIFEFIGEFFGARELSPDLRFAVDFTVEELFTNMVKYNARGRCDIHLALAIEGDRFVGTLVDADSDRFDMTEAPDADVELSLDDRRPGGLGIHLVRRMMDAIDYTYEGRTSTVTFQRASRKP